MFMKRLFLLLAVIFIVQGCEVDSDPTNAREDFLGNWTCNEFEGDFAPQTYDVQVYAIGTGHQVGISGFYNQGPAFTVTGDVSGATLFISTQVVDGITIAGSGTMNANFDRVDLTFTANDGSGPDNVKANWVR